MKDGQQTGNTWELNFNKAAFGEWLDTLHNGSPFQTVKRHRVIQTARSKPDGGTDLSTVGNVAMISPMG